MEGGADDPIGKFKMKGARAHFALPATFQSGPKLFCVAAMAICESCAEDNVLRMLQALDAHQLALLDSVAINALLPTTNVTVRMVPFSSGGHEGRTAHHSIARNSSGTLVFW